MKLFMYFDGDEPQIGLLKDDLAINFSAALEHYATASGSGLWGDCFFLSIDEMIIDGFFNLDKLAEVCSCIVEEEVLLAFVIEDKIGYELPILDPTKILALGRNYKAHAEEGGLEVPDEPIFFNKLKTTMLPHEGKIIYPPQVTRLDHEIELAVVISKRGKNIPVSEAWDYVAGYTIANDITARDMQAKDIEQANPWLRSKNFDTFSPIGPYIVPRDVIPDPHNLEMVLKVNGEIRQESNTSKMVFKIPEMISYLSQHMTLFSSDIIMTGTPEGISPLAVGDVVEATIEGLGTLRNTVVAEETDEN